MGKPLALDAGRQCRRLIGVFLHKIALPPYVPYIHLLVDYHFGFTKRALIGAIVSLFTAKVPVWLVFALGGAVWLITAGAVRPTVPADLRLRRRTSAAVRVHGGLAVLPEEFHAHARAFRHLRLRCLRSCLLLVPARSIGLCAARRAVLDHPRSDPPHSSPDVCADHRRHRGAALLSRAGRRRGRMRSPSESPRLAAIGVLFFAAQFCGIDGGARGGVRRLSAEPDGRSRREPTC